MNKIKKAVRSLNPEVRMAILMVVAVLAAMTSGFFFGHLTGDMSPIAFFVLVMTVTFVVVSAYVYFFEHED